MSVQVIRFAPGLKPVLKHQEHDQSSHGNWAKGSQGSASELSDDEIRDVIYNSKTVNEMFQKVAKRQGKSMKPSVDTLSEDEITHYRGVQDVSRDAQRLLDGKVKFTEFQTWGQGIYLAEDKSIASNYGTLIGMKLDASAKIVRGETTWDSAFDVSYENSSARTRNTTTSSFIDLGRIETQIRAGKMDNLSISDMRNVYWAAKGYDGFTTYGETVLFNGSKLTINKADIGTTVKKHQEHDQKTHGSWATGGGAGVDITEALDEVFFNNKLKIEESKIFPGNLRIVIQSEIERSGLNKETVDLIDKMSEAQIASGQAYGDNALKIIAERQGFTGKPKTVESAEDLEEIQKIDGGILVYRGLANYSKEVIEISARQSRAEIDGGKPYKQIPQILRETKELEAASVSYTAQQALTDFREGEYFGGWGVFGNGTYTTVRVEEANTYTQTRDYDNGKLGNGKIAAMLIPKDAKAPSKEVVATVVKNMVYGGEPNHRNNVGRMLASMGYQYYDAGYVQSDKGGIFVVLDRSMLTVAKKASGE